MDQDIKDYIGMFVVSNLLVVSVPFIFLWCVLYWVGYQAWSLVEDYV